MLALKDLIAFVRRNQTRRAALTDLRRLSAAQLSDIGLASDGLGDVVDSMLTRRELRAAAAGRLFPARASVAGTALGIR